MHHAAAPTEPRSAQEPVPSSPVAQALATGASYVPWATLGCFFGLVVSARARFGEWPKAMHWEAGQTFPTAANIDPGHGGAWYAATWIGIGASLLIALVAVPLGKLIPKQSQDAPLRFWMGASALLLVILINPFDLWNWYLD